jgi:hypothetical protein
MIVLSSLRSDDDAQQIAAQLYGDADPIADATTANHLADIAAAREEDIADLLSRLPAGDRPAAQAWLRTHGILPPWYEDLLAPAHQHAHEPGS